MKTTLLFFALLLAVVLSSSSAPTVSSAGNSNTKERGVAKFNQPVILLGMELKGEYLFVHDNTAMVRGEACTFVYKGTSESTKNLVAAFHCTPQSRARATYFTVRTKPLPEGTNRIDEIQFAGSTFGHVVMPHQASHTVNVAGF